MSSSAAALAGEAREFGIDDVAIGKTDDNGRKIVDVYRRQHGRYAIYQTADRVIILFAEDPLVQRIQRKRLAKLAAARSEIDGQLGEWRGRNPKYDRLYRTAREFDMRVASALEEALENNLDAAEVSLQRVRVDVAAEMASRARLSYLAWTLASALAIIATTFVLRWLLWHYVSDPKAISREMVGALKVPAAIRAGVFGAVYSIALGIQGRDLKRDLRRSDYMTDSFVRIGIGALAAFILSCFLMSGALRIEFGAAPGTAIDTAANAAGAIDPLRGGTEGGGIYIPTWPVWMIFGFLAGFAERLVPDLLNSYSVKAREGDPAPPTQVGTTAAAGAEGEAGVVASAAGVAAADDLPDDENDVIADPTPEDDVDGCDVTIDDHVTVTADEDLPPASGGVATQPGS